MNSAFKFVVGILQAALALMGFVQLHPELPQTSLDQAQQVAQPTVTQATNAIAINLPAQSATQTSSQPSSGLQTYTDERYGFSISYPTSFSRFGGTLHVPTIFSGSIQGAHDAVGGWNGGFQIDVGTSSADVSGCLSAPGLSEEKISDIKTTTINGHSFLSYKVDDTFAGGFSTGYVYRTVRDGLCFVINYDAQYSGGLAGSSLNISDEEARIIEEFRSMLQSLTITDTAPVSAPGMTKYTDSDFGFSFWYPSNWVVSIGAPDEYESKFYTGGSISRQIFARDPANGRTGVAIDEFTSVDRSITDSNPCGPLDGCPNAARYFFDVGTHTWMVEAQYAGSPSVTAAETVSNNTMGGLHIFSGTARFGDDAIVPLSARNFLIFSPGETGGRYRELVNTVVATDPSVATPVSAAEQIQAIQAERDAYAGQ